MTRRVTYRLPPYVRVVDNPQYTGGPTNYARYKLESLGNYPIGQYYYVEIEGEYGGYYLAVESTNTSVTLEYRKVIRRFPLKTQEPDFMDISEYEFAYAAYPETANLINGTSNQRLYDPDIFDYDAFETTPGYGIERLTVETDVYYDVGLRPDYYQYNKPEVIFRPKTQFETSIMRVFGSANIYLPDMPGFDDDVTEDISQDKLVDRNLLSGVKGRYLAVVKGLQGFDDPAIEIYPEFPIDRNVVVSNVAVGIDPPDIIPDFRRSARKITITYNSLAKVPTGPGHSAVLPFRKKLGSGRRPLLVTLPENAATIGLKFYRRHPDIEYKPFDFVGPFTPRPVGGIAIPANTVPAEFVNVKR